MNAPDAVLAVRGLAVAYGGIRAVRGVSFEVRRGEIVTLIGGNGAGKSSILRAISGLVAREGAVIYEGRNLGPVPPHAIVGLGIAHVPEGRGIFGNLTVEENLRLATWQRRFGRRRNSTLPQPPPLEGGESKINPSHIKGPGDSGTPSPSRGEGINPDIPSALRGEGRVGVVLRSCSFTLFLAVGLALSFAIPAYGLLNKYQQMILMYVGINIILAASLNLVNGYMGEFSLAHAGFMAVGAYTASLLTVKLFPAALGPWLFPLAVFAAGGAAAIFGLLVAVPSFKTRGDYLALVTLAFLMIVKSAIENLDVIGGPRGFLGMRRLTTLPGVFVWTVLCLWVIRNFVYSRFGRGVLAVREDEIAAELIGQDTRRVKFLAFTLSSFFAGTAGALFAHLLQFISPRVFDIIKSTDILIMVYLGGIASLAGSVIGAALYTLLLEVLRPSAVAWAFSGLPPAVFEPLNRHVIAQLGVWRMVIMPLVLVLVMLYRPRGIMGMREWRALMPKRDREAMMRSQGSGIGGQE